MVAALDGQVLAETRRPVLLFETGLPTRYYFPRDDVNLGILTPTDNRSHCPYKGQAEYWSMPSGEGERSDVAWSYRTPLPESQKIAGLISFYTEKVDVYVDGVKLGRGNG